MENIIKVKLGEISSNHLDDSIEYSVEGNEKVNIFKIIIKYLFVLLFGLVGVLITILFHKRCFHFFNKFVKNDYICTHTYHSLGKGIFSRLIMTIVSIFLSLSTFLIMVVIFVESKKESDAYDWVGLYKSLKDNGYCPDKFNDGYIIVVKYKDSYRCTEGNHRHRVLLDIYGPDKIIDVRCKDVSYDGYDIH